MSNNSQIDPWLAIEYACENLDGCDVFDFLTACRENDMVTIGQNTSDTIIDGWPEFVRWVAQRKAETRTREFPEKKIITVSTPV